MHNAEYSVKPGEEVILALPLDGRAEQPGAPLEKRVRAKVVGVYKNFAMVLMPGGWRECFCWPEFRQIRRTTL